MSYVVTNIHFMPNIQSPAEHQTSRRTSWESGIPASSSRRVSSIQRQKQQQQLRGSPQTKSPLFQTTSGPGWEVWNRTSVLYDYMNLTCNWNEYRPFMGKKNRKEQQQEQQEQSISVPFCAHPLSDDQFVSNNIVKKGRHLECDGLPKLLDYSIIEGNVPESSNVIYVDVGANIGTCVMQMLLTTNATIVAFEPHPYNLFVMTSTFMKLDESLRNRIHLFPIALGANSAASTIHMASDNRGHAVVSKVIRINKKATFLEPMPIRVEPLDKIFKPETTIHLMKMDAQGFECYIYEGMKQLLKHTQIAFFELERKVLNGFEGCSPQVLWNRFLLSGFSMHLNGLKRPPTKQMPDKGKINIIATNLPQPKS